MFSISFFLYFITANSNEDNSILEGRDGGFTNCKDSSVDASTRRGNRLFSSLVSFVGIRRNGQNGNRNQPLPEGNHNRFADAFKLMYHAFQEGNMMRREQSCQHYEEFMMMQQTNQQMMMAMFTPGVGRNVPNVQNMQQVPRGTTGEQDVSVSNKEVDESSN